MDRDSSPIALFLALAPLSLMAVGGGMSIVGNLQAIVVAHHWLSVPEFLEAFALSRVAPGPATLLVSLIGWHVGGLLGLIAASLAIFLPSSLLTYLVARLWQADRFGAWRQAIAQGLAPIAAALILSSTVRLLGHAAGHGLAWPVAAAVAALAWRTRASALALVAVGCLAFVAGDALVAWL